MFDSLMERSLPLWLLVSALLPALVIYLLFKAAIRIRQLRSLLNEATRRAVQGGGMGPAHPWQATDSEDWVASPAPDSRRA